MLSKKINKKMIEPYLLVLPALILIMVFKIYPILYSVIGSFFVKAKGGIIKFAWFTNYKFLFNDPTFTNSLWVTFKLNIFITPIQIILGIAMAIYLNRNFKSVRIARTLIYIPVAINMVVASTIWNMLLSPNQGPINSIFAKFGIAPQPFLTSPNQALTLIIIICCWKGVAYWMIFLLAGLQNVSPSLYEAGKIDGTNYFQELFFITIPMMKNSLKFVIISDTMINLFLFVPVYMLTGGGPQGSTDTLMYEAYRAAFKFANYGRSYSIVTILLLITFIIIGIQMHFLKNED
ncbi:MAG: sugar ABC transporter permease [Sphaerochaetaceae bacterium]